MSVFSLRLQRAALGIIRANLTPSLVPQTRIAAAVVGATSVTALDSVAGFQAGSMLSFWDGAGTAEELIPVASVAGQTITLNFTGLPYSGLQYAHAANTPVATNLWDAYPTDTHVMQQSGYPVISSFIWDRSVDLTRTMPLTGKVTADPLYIVYELVAQQTAGTQMDPLLWSRNRQHKVETDIDAIVALFKDPSLSKFPDPAGTVARAIPHMKISMRQLIDDQALPHYLAVLELTVDGGFI